MQINPNITSLDHKKNNAILPFAIITFIYFIVGFLTTVNEQLQAPLKFTFLSHAGSLKNTFTTLISFFSFRISPERNPGKQMGQCLWI